MAAYLDTSFLIKLYIFEPDSQRAVALLRRETVRPVIGWLSEVEMSSALHARPVAGVQGISGTSADVAYREFRLDVERGVYDVAAMDRGVFEQATRLAEIYGRRHLARALDVLHVAVALRCGAERFGTFDKRQARLADEAGLALLG